MPIRSRLPLTEPFNVLPQRCTAHADHDGSAENGLRQITNAGHRHSAIGWESLWIIVFAAHDAASNGGAPAMASIQDTANILMFAHLRTKDRVNLIEEDRGQPGGVAYPAEEIGGARINNEFRPWHEELGYLKCHSLS